MGWFYTLEERNQLVQMIGSPASVRFEQELALFRQLWCNLSVEPAHYGAESWENLKAIREIFGNQLAIGA